jgi:anti-sigma factor RsiW
MTHRATDLCPSEILEWIAWYPDGGLSDRQRGAVEAHAAVCAACRYELAVLAGHAEAPVAPADPERLFARVLALVEADGLAAPAGAGLLAAPARAVAAPAAARTLPPRRARQPWSVGAWSGGMTRVAATMALLFLVGGLGGWLGRDWVGPKGGPVYVPASATPVAAGEGLALDVVFRSDATAERIQTALRGLGAELVAGPSPLGRYRVALPLGADASAAAALLRAEGTGVASFAEPLRP